MNSFRRPKQLKPNPSLTAAIAEDFSTENTIFLEAFDEVISDDNNDQTNHQIKNRIEDEDCQDSVGVVVNRRIVPSITHSHQDNVNGDSNGVSMTEQNDPTRSNDARRRRYGCCTWQSPAPLAFSYTTPFLAKLIIPVAIIVTHCCFYYGQTAVMWKLTKSIQYDIQYEVTSNEARVVFDSLQIPLKDSFSKHEITDVKQFTYMYAIEELWKAKHMPGKVLPRTAAIMLALFSGVWPHLKLFMLLVTWIFARNPVRRARTLASLSVLGKWSLADVLVVCVMVGVLNLSWTFTANDVMHHIRNNLHSVTQLVRSTYSSEQVCSAALHFSCHNPKIFFHQVQCSSCRNTVDTLYDHPETTAFLFEGVSTSGGGKTDLYVAGLPGIYAFCFAVVASILLSCIVDFLDHLDRHDQRRIRLDEEEERRSLSSLAVSRMDMEAPLNIVRSSERIENYTVSDFSSPTMAQPLLLNSYASQPSTIAVQDFRSAADIAFDQEHIHSDDDPCRAVAFNCIAFGAAGLVICGVCFTTIERTVNGGASDLARSILGVDLTKSYSFLQLANTTALGGGWDILLLITFCLFIISGPCLRAVLCVYAMVQENTFRRCRGTFEEEDRKRIISSRLSSVIDFVGAFCAWEVFTAALVMVDLLMPSITSTIVNDKHCLELTHTSTCFEVGFDIHHRAYIAFIIVGGTLLILISQHLRSRQY